MEKVKQNCQTILPLQTFNQRWTRATFSQKNNFSLALSKTLQSMTQNKPSSGVIPLERSKWNEYGM